MEFLLGLVVFGIIITVALFLGGVVINIVFVAITLIVTLIIEVFKKIFSVFKGGYRG